MKPGDIIGGIFEVTDEFINSLDKWSSMKKFPGIKKDNIVAAKPRIAIGEMTEVGKLPGIAQWAEPGDFWLSDRIPWFRLLR